MSCFQSRSPRSKTPPICKVFTLAYFPRFVNGTETSVFVLTEPNGESQIVNRIPGRSGFVTLEIPLDTSTISTM